MFHIHNVRHFSSNVTFVFLQFLFLSITATSRSTSPSSRREPYSVYAAYRQTGTVPKRTGIPRSLANSRETSPTRSQVGTYKRSAYTMSSPRRTDRPPLNPGRPVLAQKILQQSREAENALADVLVSFFKIIFGLNLIF